MNLNTIKFVVDSLLCTSCGVCAGVCPRDAIGFDIDKFGSCTPIIGDKCVNCGNCVKVCPGVAPYNSQFPSTFHETAVLGGFIETYAGYTNDYEVLSKSQSGGFISSFLLYCFDRKLIDGAVVTRWASDNPLRTETFIAKNRAEVLTAVGSKYNSVPAGKIIRQILNQSGKYVFVGMSCQIQGMRKAEALLPSLSDSIFMYIGLHCLGVFTYHYHSQILSKINLLPCDVKKFCFRDKRWLGWPCDMRIEDRGGNIHNIYATKSRLWPRNFFTNWRCQLCYDKANEYSDISTGDCRIPSIHQQFTEDGYDIKKGLSEFVVRSERGRAIIDRMLADSILTVKKVAPEEIGKSIGVSGKKLGVKYFCAVNKLVFGRAPEYNVSFVNKSQNFLKHYRIVTICSYVFAFRQLIIYYLSKFRMVRFILKRVPHKWFYLMDVPMRKSAEWERYSAETDILRIERRK